MWIRFLKFDGRWILAAAACLLTAIMGLATPAAAAAETKSSPSSLQWVPDDVAFYSCMLRNREQFEAIANSRAWAKFRALSFVQKGLAAYDILAMSPYTGPGKINALLQDPEMQDTWAVLGDMLSHEVFIIGDQDVAQTVVLVQKLMAAGRYGPAIAMLQSKAKHEFPDLDNARGTAILTALAQNVDKLRVPSLIVGFRVKDAAAAQKQLDRLEKVLTAALEDVPQLKGQCKKTKVAGIDCLVLSLDGKMLPWDEMPLDDLRKFEVKKGDLDRVAAQLKKTTLVVAIGLRGNDLLVSVGPSTAALERLGKGKPLASRPELAPLAKFADKRLTSVHYVSKALNAGIDNNRQNLDDLLGAIRELLPLTGLPSAEQTQIQKDATALAGDLKNMIPDPGPMLGVSFLTDRGSESYRYVWGEQRQLDATKPLDLLEHVGGSPLAALVNRTKVEVRDYDLLVKWIGVGYGYFQKYGLPQMPKNERAKAEKFLKAALPQFERIHKTTRESLLPALADGQIGIVLDARMSSKQFLKHLPPTAKPMPMIEPALVFGVSDSQRLAQACGEYREAFNALIEAAKGIEGNTIPKDFTIPAPKVMPVKAGTLYTYRLPKDWGVDEQITPNAGLSNRVAVLSLSIQHSDRLLNSVKPQLGGKPLATDRPLAVAGFLDFAGLIDAATPWVDLAVKKIVEKQAADGGDVNADDALSQTRAVLDILKVLRTVNGRTYREGPAMVDHLEFEFHDLPE